MSGVDVANDFWWLMVLVVAMALPIGIITGLALWWFEWRHEQP